MLQETAVSRIHYRNSTCFATDIQMVVGIKKSADSGTLKLGIGRIINVYTGTVIAAEAGIGAYPYVTVPVLSECEHICMRKTLVHRNLDRVDCSPVLRFQDQPEQNQQRKQ